MYKQSTQKPVNKKGCGPESQIRLNVPLTATY